MFDMLSNVIKNLFSAPATRTYPYAKRESFDRTRGMLDIEINQCIFCGICQRKCPSDAIIVTKNERKWSVDHFKCVMCAACEEACPKKCLHMSSRYKAPEAAKERYVAIKEDEPMKEAAGS